MRANHNLRNSVIDSTIREEGPKNEDNDLNERDEQIDSSIRYPVMSPG